MSYTPRSAGRFRRPGSCGTWPSPLRGMRPILLDVDLPLLRQVGGGENGTHRTLRLTGTTGDAFVGVNVELVFAAIDRIDRTHVYTGPVLHADARLGYHIEQKPLWGLGLLRPRWSEPERGHDSGSNRDRSESRGAHEPAPTHQSRHFGTSGDVESWGQTTPRYLVGIERPTDLPPPQGAPQCRLRDERESGCATQSHFTEDSRRPAEIAGELLHRVFVCATNRR